MQAYVVKKIGENRGIPRLWLEGQRPVRAGFTPGARYRIVHEDHSLVLKVSESGPRTVTPRGDGKVVIDLNSREALAPVVEYKVVRIIFRKNSIHVLPLASEVRRREREDRLRKKILSGEPISIGSFAHGGGVLTHAVHAGLSDAGVASNLAFANEIDEDLLEHASRANDAWSADTKFLAAPMQEVVFDEWARKQIPEVDILEGGIPCSGASRAGRSKRSLSLPEAHPEVGHLIVSAISLIAKVNPCIVLVENVPEYAKSASGYVLRSSLRDLGYVVQERIVSGAEFNQLENRVRWALVGVSQGIQFDFSALEIPERIARKLAEVLEPIADNDPCWSRMEYLKAKEERDREAGKGFRMQIVDENSENVGCIGKYYGKVRSTEPKLKSKFDKDLLRQLTPVEHARVKGVPEHLIGGLAATPAHELLGQGIVYEPFRAIGRLIGKAIAGFAKISVPAVASERMFGICG